MIVLLAALALCASRPAAAASGLMLAPDLSFTDDSSSNFPITGKELADGTISPAVGPVIFFGTSHCWNTNREAERLVALYPRYRDRFNFIVVDLNAVRSRPTSISRVLLQGLYPDAGDFQRARRTCL